MSKEIELDDKTKDFILKGLFIRNLVKMTCQNVNTLRLEEDGQIHDSIAYKLGNKKITITLDLVLEDYE